MKYLSLSVRAAAMTVPVVALVVSAQAEVTVKGSIKVGDFTGTPIVDSYNTGPLATLNDGVTYNRSGADLGPGLGITSSASSGGGAGYVGAYVSAEYRQLASAALPYNRAVISHSEVLSKWSDVTISGPAGTTVPFSANMVIDGNYLQQVSAIAGEFNSGWSARSDVGILIWLNGTNIFQGTWGAITNPDSPNTFVGGTGDLFDYTGHLAFATRSVMVPANTPIELMISLSVNASATTPSNGGANIAASMDFAHTISLNPVGAAFNLPGGYTVNSSSANVNDNLFTLTPAPGSGLVLAGWLGICGRRSRRR